MINVFFPYYDSKDLMRQQEIDLCLQKNLANPFITKLVVLIDDESQVSIQNDKLVVKYLTSRPTYRAWIELTKELCLNGISLICNSDIYFDNSISMLPDWINDEEKLLALSRWEQVGDEIELHKVPKWSQDTWAFHCNSVFSNEMLKELDFSLGVPRCDNKIAYIFAIRGWKVLNPCSAIKSIHVHESQLRTYHKKLDDRILGGVAYVHPVSDVQEESQLDIDIWTKRTVLINQVTLNKTMEKWIAESRSTSSETKQHKALNTKALAGTEAIVQSSVQKRLLALKSNKVIYSPSPSFKVFVYENFVYFNNLFEPKSAASIELEAYQKNTSYYNVCGFIPAVIDTYSSQIRKKPLNESDLNFWQYPCATEEQAYNNHVKLNGAYDHIDMENRILHTYLPLPWATYIDKKDFPVEFLERVTNLIQRYKNIALENNFQLKVHSVCQHIHWIRILKVAEKLGVTDLHLSHKDSKSDQKQSEEGKDLKLHGWSLIAVNYETPERKAGMERKPISERKLLASFIGAHMKHYRDDSRIKLFEAAKNSGRDDVFVDLGNEWHFNKVVYEVQVLNREIDSQHVEEHNQKTFKYNTLLSDSKFSLCPEGAGPNTLRFWESIAVGSIPVIFSDNLSIFLESSEGKTLLKQVVVWNQPINKDLFIHLSSINEEDLQSRSTKLIEIYQRIKQLKGF